MPAMIKYGMRRGSIEIGAGDNVIMAWSGGATALLETLTPNNVTPYVTSTTDLRNGPVVLDVPKATDKANCSPSEELRALLSPSSSDGLHYGPLEGYIDKSWVLNDLELVK